MAYRCNLCVGFIGFTLALLLNHIFRCHSDEPSFHVLCGINGCTRTYKKFLSFRNHVNTKHKDVKLAERHHRENTEQENDISSESEMEFDIDDDGPQLYDDAAPLPRFDFEQESEEIRRTSALHLLKMKDRDRASQTAIDSFVDNTTSIVRTSIDLLKRGLMNRLDTAGIDFNTVPGLPELFQENSLAMNPFSGLREEAQQCQYYKDHFNLVVSTTFAFIIFLSAQRIGVLWSNNLSVIWSLGICCISGILYKCLVMPQGVVMGVNLMIKLQL